MEHVVGEAAVEIQDLEGHPWPIPAHVILSLTANCPMARLREKVLGLKYLASVYLECNP